MSPDRELGGRFLEFVDFSDQLFLPELQVVVAFSCNDGNTTTRSVQYMYMQCMRSVEQPEFGLTPLPYVAIT